MTTIRARLDKSKKGQPSTGSHDGQHRTMQPHGRSAMVHSIADAVVIKHEALFFLCAQGGGIPVTGEHGLGLYYHDTRYLSGYQLAVAGKPFNSLVASAAPGYVAVIELTNPELTEHDGTTVKKDRVGVKLTRLVDHDQLAVHDLYQFRNYSPDTIELPLAFEFAADFADIFEVRSLTPQPPGTPHPPRWANDTLRFSYSGKDGVQRHTTVRMTPVPGNRTKSGATTTITLQPAKTRELRVSITVQESRDEHTAPPAPREPADIDAVRQALDHDAQQFLDECAQVKSDNNQLERTIRRSLSDLRMLRSELDGQQYLAAGVPWYVTLFGRDSIIACLQTLAFDAMPAEHTLRLLAQYQGTKVDDWRDEQPGKIMHELRVGELAHLNEIPQTPYYGSIDSTPLFLILVARHASWTGSDALFHDLRDNVDRALRWIADYGDPAHDGYTAYKSTSSDGLANQGWKDSGDAIVNADGSLGRPPIALVEVQGYVYAAKVEIAALYRRGGDAARADQLEREAADLRRRTNRDFWMDDEGTFALALEKGGEQVRVVSSNAGQALWSGIADDDKARRIAERLLRDDMCAGWGVRTLSSDEKRYNPVGYHLGTVWPHDNSLIAAGFRRYGLDDEAHRIFAGILDAATYFDDHRLPEVFAGFARGDYDRPVRYPVACHPQAWASGAVPYLLQVCLGLQAEGFEQRLKVVDPTLPRSCTHLELRNIHVGNGTADLRFERTGDGVRMRVLRAEGGLRVTREHRKAGRDGG